MIVNSGKFQAIIFDEHKVNHTNQIIKSTRKKLKRYQKLSF